MAIVDGYHQHESGGVRQLDPPGHEPGQDPDDIPFQPRGDEVQDEEDGQDPGRRRLASLKVTTWNCAKQPTQPVLDIAPRADVLVLQEINPPRTGTNNACWKGRHLICASRPVGRRHGVCRLVLSGEAWSKVTAMEEGRWA